LQRIFSDEMTHTKQHYVCLWSVEDIDAWLKRFS
jgi:hypothetical protein